MDLSTLKHNLDQLTGVWEAVDALKIKEKSKAKAQAEAKMSAVHQNSYLKPLPSLSIALCHPAPKSSSSSKKAANNMHMRGKRTE
jgi:hypothetical protein